MRLSEPSGKTTRTFTFNNAFDGTTTRIHFYDDYEGKVLIEGHKAEVGEAALKLVPIEALLAFARYVEKNKDKPSRKDSRRITQRTILDALVGSMSSEELRAATHLTPTHFNRRMNQLLENKQVHRWTDDNVLMYRVNDEEVTRILQPNDDQGEQR